MKYTATTPLPKRKTNQKRRSCCRGISARAWQRTPHVVVGHNIVQKVAMMVVMPMEVETRNGL